MRLIIAILCLMATLAPLVAVMDSSNAAPPQYDIIIRNGRVVDGSGRPAFNSDVAIQADRIALIGNLRGAKARREIDARC